MSSAPHTSIVDLQDLHAVERRVLWLSAVIVHWANNVRPKTDPLKVGGHQASSASCVSLMTALYFGHLAADDRVSVKPHASPVLYAIGFLLGRLAAEDLKTLREFGGLQSYPSQTKNPELVDFSTGSVGLGATAANYAALAQAYMSTHVGEVPRPGSYWSIVGDAELDEGNVWETLAEPLLDGVPGIRWIVDLNRQSLDRIVPGVRTDRLKQMFAANGWRVIEAKYGLTLRELFDRDGGTALRRRLDDMSNEEYQVLLASGPAQVRSRLVARLSDDERKPIEAAVAGLDDVELHRRLSSLGGHDLEVLLDSYAQADSHPTPAVVFAYTVKGWGLPFAGNPGNHSALMTNDQMGELSHLLDIGADWFASLSGSDPGAVTVERACARLARTPSVGFEAIDVPKRLAPRRQQTSSTQEAFGRALLELTRSAPEVAARIVTAAPDVAASTNLAGWINKVGVWRATQHDSFLEEGLTALRWNESPAGRHLELGISEMNLFSLLGQLGLTAERHGTTLLPIGTVYDTFIPRGLDALIYGLYCESKFLMVGTPSGVTLAPEGGAHQSTVTPSLGIELPNLVTYEPCFATEVEIVLLNALDRIARRETSVYLRLSTMPVDQSPFERLTELTDPDDLANRVLSGCYRLVDRRTESDYRDDRSVLLFASGVMVPEAAAASDILLGEGVFASVFNVTSADLLYRAWQSEAQRSVRTAVYRRPVFDVVSPAERGRPAVTVVDGHPHSLGFIGTALGVDSINLGPTSFGQSGSVSDLYRHLALDAGSIVNAVLAVLA